MFNLDENYDMVHRIVKSKFHKYNYDLEDLVQDVCMKIHRQNLGDNPYNPTKSSVTSYIYMVAQGIVTKAWDKSKRDPVVQASNLEDEYQERATSKDHFNDVYMRSFEDLLQEESEELAEMFELMVSGFSRREIATMSPFTEHQIRRGREKMQEIFQEVLN